MHWGTKTDSEITMAATRTARKRSNFMVTFTKEKFKSSLTLPLNRQRKKSEVDANGGESRGSNWKTQESRNPGSVSVVRFKGGIGEMSETEQN